MVFSGRVPLHVHIVTSPHVPVSSEVKWTALPNYSMSTLSKMNLNIFISLLREVITSLIIDSSTSPILTYGPCQGTRMPFGTQSTSEEMSISFLVPG